MKLALPVEPRPPRRQAQPKTDHKPLVFVDVLKARLICDEKAWVELAGEFHQHGRYPRLYGKTVTHERLSHSNSEEARWWFHFTFTGSETKLKNIESAMREWYGVGVCNVPERDISDFAMH